ncbi:MAG: D-3-phosphoglycerate dehydrogenase, partial [uncultured Nocardioidaceae bacterium]
PPRRGGLGRLRGRAGGPGCPLARLAERCADAAHRLADDRHLRPEPGARRGELQAIGRGRTAAAPRGL